MNVFGLSQIRYINSEKQIILSVESAYQKDYLKTSWCSKSHWGETVILFCVPF